MSKRSIRIRRNIDGLYIVLVFGGREYEEADKVFKELDRLDKKRHIDAILQGWARGADVLGEAWAAKRQRICICVPAEWLKYRKAAGPIRNLRMLDLFVPNFAMGFHDDIKNSKGTKNMAERCEKRGFKLKTFFGG